MSTPAHVLVPICVTLEDLPRTTRFYEKVLGVDAGPELVIDDAGLVGRTVGTVLLLAGPPEALAEPSQVRAIAVVDDLEERVEQAEQAGATIVKGPTQVKTGTLSHLRHPDGSVFEYLTLA